MPKPRLRADLAALESDILETLLAGLKEWRPDLSYPESCSDMRGCIRALLRMFEVKRRPLALSSLPLHCDTCGGTGRVDALVNGDPRVIERIACPECAGVHAAEGEEKP